MDGSDMTLSVCPPVVEYSQAELARAADEIEGLPEGAVLTGMLADYAVLREQARYCTKIIQRNEAHAGKLQYLR
jgi:hypothetical protein